MSVVPPLSGPPLYRYIPGVGRAVAVETNVAKYSTFGGGVYVVDRVYGNDSNALRDPFNRPFFNLTTALSNAPGGTSIYLMPGTYPGPITIPANVCIVGNCTQNCFISASNVTSNTTLVTMGSNTRVEFVTMNLTSSCNVNLTGVDFPTGTSINAKLRTCVVNVISSGTGSNTIIGLLSAGSSDTSYNSSDATRGITVNVDASSSGPIRGVLVSGSNWFGVRDTNINAKGTGSNIVGIETTNAGAYASVKHSTVRGGDGIGIQYDINRTTGEILLGSVDLKNNTANGNSFSVTTEGAITHYGTTGNFSVGTTYYLVPGFVRQGDLPATPFRTPVTQNMILFSGTFQCNSNVPVGGSVKLTAYKNDAATDMSMTIIAGETLASNVLQSVDYRQGDRFDLRMDPSGGPGVSFNNFDFAASFAFY